MRAPLALFLSLNAAEWGRGAKRPPTSRFRALVRGVWSPPKGAVEGNEGQEWLASVRSQRCLLDYAGEGGLASPVRLGMQLCSMQRNRI